MVKLLEWVNGNENADEPWKRLKNVDGLMGIETRAGKPCFRLFVLL
jgi:hypothetical protein